jgi:hypothetical protein
LHFFDNFPPTVQIALDLWRHTTMTSEDSSRLVFDIGFNNGDDTAHYLEGGFRVVAVEANPQLVMAGRERFAEAIASGRLHLVGAGIAEHTSFLPDAGKRGAKFSVVSVPTVTIIDLFREYDLPRFFGPRLA